MAEMSTIVEGNVKFRDGKKWKPRWCVMKKPSPVADRLIVHLYKDVKESVKGGHPKSVFPLDSFFGLESGICFDKETSVLAIICMKQITLLAFDSRETLIQFEIKIRRSLGEEHQFPVRTIKVPSHSKLPLDLLRMHIHGQKFCLTGHIPPKILCSWQVSELRRFGIIDGRFCFEGGSRCGKGQGSHVLETDQVEEILEIISHASVGKSAPLIKRQSGKRRSEFLDPVKNVVSDNVFKKFQNTQVFADQNYLEDNSWPRYKRHSISFTDYNRAKTYAEKQHLQSIENVERDRLMAIYDVPPRRIRKVEHVPNENSVNVRSYDVNLNALRNLNTQNSQGDENYLNWTGEFNNNVMSYQVPMTTTNINNQSESTISTNNQNNNQIYSTSSHGSAISLNSINSCQSEVPMSSSAPVLCNLGNQLFVSKCQGHSQSVPAQIAEEIEKIIDNDKRDDVMQRLNQSEQDLEKEMSLLDEMLQLCQRNEGGYDEEKSQQPPPLPVKLSHLRGFSLDNDARGSLDNLSISSDNTHCRPSPNTGYSKSVLLSPNLVNKLKRISKKSKMSAPLPYVNLSKYDGFDVDSNHVHLPAASTSAPDGGSSWNDLQRCRSKGYDNVKADRDSEKENKRISISLPGSRENLRNLSGSDLHVNARARNHSFSNEPIYANERCVTPPPELPPKGPGLRNKQKVSANSRPPAPPRPPDRQSLAYQRQIRQKLQNQKSLNNSVSSSSSSQQEDYFVMDSFEKEPTHCKIDYNESQRLNASLNGRSFVSLPPKDHRSVRMDPVDCYMLMTGLTDQEKSINEGMSSRPQYMRSVSVGSTSGERPLPHAPLQRPDSVSAGNSPKEPRREKLIREENYMLMSSVSPKKPVLENLQTLSEYVNSSKIVANLSETSNEKGICKNLSFNSTESSLSVNSSGTDLVSASEDMKSSNSDITDVKDVRREQVNIEMPFDNLIDFTLPHEHVKTSKNVQLNVSVEKNDSSNSKTPGFFSRLMRRNSKDRKSASQSHENLLTTVSSEPTIKEDVAVFSDSSSSGENSRAQSQQDLNFSHTDRNRSSSFPNRSSYIAMNESNSSSSTGISVLSQHSDLAATNSSLNSCETVSTRASSNEGQLNESLNTSEQVLSDSEMGKGNYDQQSYFYMGPLQGQSNTADKNGENIADDRKNGENDDDNASKDHEVDKEKHESEVEVAKVFTVLNVQGGNFDKDLCKTDDEKLIDLWHSTHSLCSDTSDKISDLKSKLTLPLEELSPDEKANAIARHISSLPPFVPPKMKSYPNKLSPVLERSTPKKEKPDPLKLSGDDDDIPDLVESPVLSPSIMKQQAKATLRITPPSEDEHGKIWIPRTSQLAVETPDVSNDTKNTTLVLDVSDLIDSDSVSLSSFESSCHGEDVVRSSPASTILRPRSGKEYQKIERRRTIDDSSTTSPLTTPQSPATGSVFTFDNLGAQSLSSGTSSAMGDLHSFKVNQSEQTSICTASLKNDSIQSPKALYMNIDFTPPESPKLPLEQIEPMLNYAEIDLSDIGRSESSAQLKKLNYAEMDLSPPELRPEFRFSNVRPAKKGKKTVEPLPIEYSMIDMVATQAAEKARKEHAINRDGSLRRDRFPSVSSSITKERLGNLSTKSERKQTNLSNVGQSMSSVDSTTF
ncbi:Protein Dok-7 [Mactra antiquata]